MDRKIGRWTFVVLSSLCGASVAQAAAEAPTKAGGTPESAKIEEIVVTAARREQRLQDTALAVTALSADRLASSELTDTSRLQTSVPSLQYSAGGGASFIYLRGIGSNVFGS